MAERYQDSEAKGERMKQKFDVTGMTCSACSSRVEKCVRKLEGVEEVSVNLLTNSMQVEFQEDKLSAGQIAQAVEKEGYGAFPRQEGKSQGNGAGNTGAAVGAGSRQKAGGTDLMEQQRRNMELRLKVSFCIFDSSDVCIHGTYGGPAAAFFSGGGGECRFLCTGAISFVSSHYLCEPCLLY